MAFGLLLLFLFPLLAFAMAHLIWQLRYHHLDPDNENRPAEKVFLRWTVPILTITLIICIPLLVKWRNEVRVRHYLHNLPLVTVMQTYRRPIYEQLRDRVEAEGIDDIEVVERSLEKAIEELRLAWIYAVPYASTDAVMRYIRYRYDEVSLLAEQGNNELCLYISSPNNHQTSQEDVTFMQKNAPYIRDAMIMVFTSFDIKNRLSYLEKRTAKRRYDSLLQKLDKKYNLEQTQFASERDCQYQKDFYLNLLNYSDTDMTKIMRWAILQQIEAFPQHSGKKD